MPILSYVLQVARDATNGSEIGKSMAYYVLDALLAIDHHQVFLSQLQSRGILHSCLAEISSNSYQVSHKFSRQSVSIPYFMLVLTHVDYSFLENNLNELTECHTFRLYYFLQRSHCVDYIHWNQNSPCFFEWGTTTGNVGHRHYTPWEHFVICPPAELLMLTWL